MWLKTWRARDVPLSVGEGEEGWESSPDEGRYTRASTKSSGSIGILRVSGGNSKR